MNKPEAMIGQVTDKVKVGVLIDEATRTFLSKQLQAFTAFSA